jgi:hypothetical protein
MFPGKQRHILTPSVSESGFILSAELILRVAGSRRNDIIRAPPSWSSGNADSGLRDPHSQVGPVRFACDRRRFTGKDKPASLQIGVTRTCSNALRPSRTTLTQRLSASVTAAESVSFMLLLSLADIVLETWSGLRLLHWGSGYGITAAPHPPR